MGEAHRWLQYAVSGLYMDLCYGGFLDDTTIPSLNLGPLSLVKIIYIEGFNLQHVYYRSMR